MRALVILGHPRSDSFCNALAEAHAAGLRQAGATAALLRLGELEFSPLLDPADRTLGDGHRQGEGVHLARELILAAGHLVFVHPVWWGNVPALLKGFLDQTLLREFAYRWKANSPRPEGLLAGRTARVVETMDAPAWWNRFVYGSPAFRAMDRATLRFCGVKPVSRTSIGGVRKLDAAGRTRWLARLEELGRRDGAALVRARAATGESAATGAEASSRTLAWFQ